MNEIRFVTYENNNDTEPVQQSLTPEEFYEWLGDAEEIDCAPCKGKKCHRKDGLAWAPGYIPQGRRRRDTNVVSFDVIAFDLDHLSQDTFEGLCGRLDADDVDCLFYSTHSHKPPSDLALRLVCSLSRRITAREMPAIWAASVLKFEIPADPASKNVSRLFYTFRVSAGAPRVSIRNVGRPFDVDQLLLDQMSHAREQQKVAPTEPIDVGEVNLSDLKSFLRAYKGANVDLVRKVLMGKPLADKGGRDDALVKIAPTIAWLLPIGTPTAAAMELLRPSIAAMPTYSDDDAGESPEGWMSKAQEKYEWAAAQKLGEANALTRLAAQARANTNAGTGTTGAGEEKSEGDEGRNDDSTDANGKWRLKMRTKVSKSGEVVPETLGWNVVHMLQNHAGWQRLDGRPVLRFNEVTKEVECFGGPIAEADRIPAQLLTAIELWLQRVEKLDVKTADVERAVFYVARQNAYDPWREYLLDCKQRWDGSKRLERFFVEYCGARSVDDEGRDVAQYLALVGVKMFVGAAARGLTPGCKMDNVPVLEGRQGIGKSAALRILGGRFFTDAPMALASRDDRMLVCSSALIEMPELSAMRRTETEAQKAFFSAREDKFRPPYGRVVETFPRRCIFVGTTNEDEYLADVTGNRRFWPVYCERFNLIALERDRDQIWGEGVHRFETGETWWFSSDESEELETITNQRLRGSESSEVVLEWWQKMEPTKRPARFALLDVAVDAFGLQKHQIGEKQCQIGQALRKIGFTKHRRRTAAGLVWEYQSTEELRVLPKVESRLQQKLRAIDGGNSAGANA